MCRDPVSSAAHSDQGGTSDIAILLDGVEQSLGDGPCLEAIRTFQPVLLPDTGTAGRWPEYSQSVAAAGSRSVLGVPLQLGKEASAALNFFAIERGLFTQESIDEAAVFGDMAGQALRIAPADLLQGGLTAVLESRTAIDLATGIIMEQNHCSQNEAVAKLKKASANRNDRLRHVAEEILKNRTSPGHATALTRFDY